MSELAEFRGGPLDGRLMVVRDLYDVRVPVLRDPLTSYIATDAVGPTDVAFDVVVYRCASWRPYYSERGVYIFEPCP